MNLKKYQPILETGILALVVFCIHKLIFYFNQTHPKFQNFYFSIDVVYSFFFACALLIIFALIFIKNKDINNVGFAFLWLTCLKMGISYAFLYPILQSNRENIGFEKGNFLIVFSLFLIIETIVTIRILNNKQ